MITALVKKLHQSSACQLVIAYESPGDFVEMQISTNLNLLGFVRPSKFGFTKSG